MKNIFFKSMVTWLELPLWLCRVMRHVSVLLPGPASFVSAALLLGPLLALAQNDKQVWVQPFGSTFGSKDLAYSIARDSSGNSIVAGTSDEGGLGVGIVVVKYSAAGAVLWINHYNTAADDYVRGVAVDASGNVFVTGASGLTVLTLAFSSSGRAMWTNAFEGESNISAPAVDGSGNVFVTATLRGAVSFGTFKYSGTGSPLWTNIFASGYLNQFYEPTPSLAMDSAGNVVARVRQYLVKYANNGAVLWTNGCPQAVDLNHPRGLAMDETGNVYLLGQSPGGFGGLPNNVIAKYSSAGTALWTNKFANGSGQSLAVDPQGNVSVAVSFGTSYPYGMRTVKYAADGTLLWLNEFTDYWGQDFSYPPVLTAASDGNGNVFVSGYCIRGDDQITIKYSAEGSALWTNRCYVRREDDEVFDRPYPSLTIDADGSALLAGYFFNEYNTDFAIRKYTSDGAEAWTAFYDGAVSDWDYPNAMAVDSSGNIIVTGGGHHDYVTLKYSPSGVPLWTNYFDGSAHVWDIAKALAVASNGTIFVTGKSSPGIYEDVTGFWVTLAYSGDGVPLWTNACQSFESPVAIAADNNGDVIVSGDAESFWGYGGWATIKYSGSGVPLWTNIHAGMGSDSWGWMRGMAVDGSGGVIVVGSSTRSVDDFDIYDFAAIKYSSSGSALWTNYFNRGGYAEAKAVAVWTNGDIFVTGTSQTTNSASSDIVTIKYSAAGVALWTNVYDGPRMLGDFVRGLALDGSGSVLLTGYTVGTNGGAEFVTIKYSNNGAALWTNYCGGSVNQTPNALAVDGNGNVFVTGNSSDTFSADSIVVAYSSGGMPLWTNRYFGPLRHADEGRDIAATGVGQVVVLGASSGDFATIKYDSGFALNINSQPLDQINNAGTTAIFSVGISGTAPFTFQWRRNGMDLADGGNISGATTATLTIPGVTTNDAGNYSVVVSNPAGSMTSASAVLSVVLPNTPPWFPASGVMVSENNVILNWPTNFAGLTLESTTNLTSPVVWSVVTNSRVILGGQYAVTIPRSGGAQFFRLLKP